MGRREYRLCDLGIAAFSYLCKKQGEPERRKYCSYGNRFSVVSGDGRDRGAGGVYEFSAIEGDNGITYIRLKRSPLGGRFEIGINLMLQKHNIMIDDAHFRDIIIIIEGHFALHVLRAGT